MSKYKVGDWVTVRDPGSTYDEYDIWHDIKHVPDFVEYHLPIYGFEYQITHVGEHTIHPDLDWQGNFIYVLEGRYMVSGDAFIEPESVELDWGMV